VTASATSKLAEHLPARPVRVLIDTGAASTVVSFALAQELGLKLTPLGRKGGGAGAAQIEIFQLEDASLSLDHAHPRPKALYAMDLSHVNAALAVKGAAPVERNPWSGRL
jgi:Aspartyl protease